MKILRWIMICLLILGLSACRKQTNKKTEIKNNQETQAEKDPNKCSVEIKNALDDMNNLDETEFRMRLMRLAAGHLASDSEVDLKILKKCLNEFTLEDKSPRKNMLLLFLKAETDYKLKNFEEAYQQYLELKLSLDNKEDPLFSEIEMRLETSAQKVSSLRKGNSRKDSINKTINKIIDSKMSFLIILCFLILLPFLFVRWNRRFSMAEGKRDIPSDEHSEDSPSTIIPAKSLITIEELCQQDGRVSFSSVKKYKANRDNWDPDHEDQTSQYSRLIFEGHKMIKRVNQLAPYPLAVVSRIPLIKKLPDFWRNTVTGFLFISLWLISLNFAGYDFSKPDSSILYVSLFLVAALIISSLTALRIMAGKTINSLDEMICMMEVHKPSEKIPQSIRKMEQWIRELFRSPWQFFIVIMIFFIIIMRVLIKFTGKNFPAFRFVHILFCIPILLVVCPIVWFIISSLLMINKISKMKDLAINPLSPLKTMGLEKWISLIGTCNITASIILSFGASIPLMTKFFKPGSVSGGWFWLALIMPLLFTYWIYPYIKLGGLVKDLKRKRMQFMKTRIAQIFNAWIMFEQDQLEEIEKCTAANKKCDIESLFGHREKMMKKLEPYIAQMENYYEVFKKIDESPHSYMDFYSVLELGEAMGIPSLFALISALLL